MKNKFKFFIRAGNSSKIMAIKMTKVRIKDARKSGRKFFAVIEKKKNFQKIIIQAVIALSTVKLLITPKKN